jgi:hypothetical protein
MRGGCIHAHPAKGDATDGSGGPRKRGDDMDEKDDEIAHLGIVTRKANKGHLGANQQFAGDRILWR